MTRPSRESALSMTAAFAVATLTLSGCQVFQDDPEVEPEVVSGFDPDTELVFDNPDQFDGEPVDFQGQVAEVIGSTAFAVKGPDGTTWEPLLVVHDGSAVVDENGTVRVKGVVDASLDIAELEADLGVDVDDGLLASNVGDGYVRAEDVTPAP